MGLPGERGQALLEDGEFGRLPEEVDLAPKGEHRSLDRIQSRSRGAVVRFALPAVLLGELELPPMPQHQRGRPTLFGLRISGRLGDAQAGPQRDNLFRGRGQCDGQLTDARIPLGRQSGKRLRVILPSAYERITLGPQQTALLIEPRLVLLHLPAQPSNTL